MTVDWESQILTLRLNPFIQAGIYEDAFLLFQSEENPQLQYKVKIISVVETSSCTTKKLGFQETLVEIAYEIGSGPLS